MKQRKALIISDFDSRIAWCNGFASRLKFLDFHITFVALNSEDDLSQRIISDNIDTFKYVESFNDLDKVFTEEYGLIVLMVGGGMYLKIYDVFKKCYQGTMYRPVIISGFNGIEDVADPQGILVRSMSDYICINSLSFFEYAQDLFSKYSLDAQLVRTGFIRDYWSKYTLDKPDSIRKVMLVLQPGILDHPKQLNYLGDKIRQYHERHPDREIVIKARGRKEIPHVNSAAEKDFYMDFWHQVASKIGSGVTVCYEETETVLNEMDVVISFTSAVLIEALVLNKKVAALSDYGISKNIGNSFLIDSNLLIPFEEVLQDNFPKVNSKWKDVWCLFEPNLLDALIIDSYRLYELQDTKGKLPFKVGFYNEKRHPYLFLFKNESPRDIVPSKSTFKKFKNKIKWLKEYKESNKRSDYWRLF